MTLESLTKLYEDSEKVDIPKAASIENTEEFLKRNHAIPLSEFIERVGKFIGDSSCTTPDRRKYQNSGQE